MKFPYLTGIEKSIMADTDLVSKYLDSSVSSSIQKYLRETDLSFVLAADSISSKLTTDLDRYFNQVDVQSFVKHEYDRFSSISTVLSELHEATRFNSFGSLDEIINKSIKLKNDTFENYIELTKGYQVESVSTFQFEIEKIHKQLNSYPSIEKLFGLKNSPFELFRDFELPDLEEESLSPDPNLEEIEQRLSEELGAVTDYNLLSDKTKQRLIYIYHTYIVPILVGFLFLYIQNNHELAQREFDKANTPAEVRSIARTPNKNFSHTALRGFRVTTAEGLNIRDDPSMQSEVIGFLPLGTLVDVIDRSNRSWLLVEVEIEEELIVGWIGRSHTKYFRGN